MLQKFLAPILLAALLAGGVACAKKQTAAQQQAAKKQAFRTKQKGEAIRAYTELTTKYPDSEFAPKAQERLTALGPMPATPASKKK